MVGPVGHYVQRSSCSNRSNGGRPSHPAPRDAVYHGGGPRRLDAGIALMPKKPPTIAFATRALLGALLAFVCTAAHAAPAAGARAPKEPLIIQVLDWRGFGLVLQASAPIVPEVFALSAPHRFVVDLPVAEFADPALSRTIPIGKDGIKQVRMARQANGAIRLVFDCEGAPAFQVMQLGDKATLVVARAGQHDAALAAMVRDAADDAGGADGQELRGIWAREQGDQITLHVGGPKDFQYVLFQEAPDRMKLRVPRGKYQGLLPPRGKLLERAEVKAAADGWTMDIDLADGHYEVRETRDPEGGVTLVWERVEPRARAGRPLVVIDPGHGGADPGAIGPGGRREKEVCLSLGHALRAALSRRGLNAILTRGADAEVHLAPRLAMVERWHADLFVSLHANSHTTNDASGLETYWREPASQAFAETVHRTVTTLLRRPDRGTKQEKLYVLRHTRVPSLLLESGFISNPGEERLLDDPDFQAQTAFAIASGIENYLVGPSLGCEPRSPSSLVVHVP